MSIRRLAMRGVSRLTVFPANPPTNNNPPAWDSQPSALFDDGDASTFDMNLIASDADGDKIVYSLNTGAASLPSNVTWGANIEGDGTNYLDGGDVAAYDFGASADFSLECRVKNPGAGGQIGLVTKKDGANAGYGIFLNPGTEDLIVEIEDAAANNVSQTFTNAILSNDRWHHIGVSVDRTANEISVYVDKIELSGSPISISTVTGSLASAAAFRVFADSVPNVFDGQIDDVRIWNDVRTAAEFSANNDIELGGAEAGLIGYWKLNGTLLASVTTVTDDSPNTNTLTDTGAGDLKYAASGRLLYDGTSPLSGTSGHVATLDDGIDTTDSVSFSIQTGIPFPRLAGIRIGAKNFGEDDTPADEQRDAIAKLDMVILGRFSGSSMDTPSAGWKDHAEIVQDLKAKNADILIFWYFNATETSDDGNAAANKINAETGPTGAEAFWGSGNNDWWYRSKTGSQVSAGFGPMINLTDHVTADAGGEYYGEWYADNSVQDFLDRLIADGVSIGADGANPYLDVFEIWGRRSAIDPNGDGTNEDMQDFYDPENSAHVAADPNAVIAIGKHRQGHQNCVDRIRTNNSNAIVIANLDTWGRDYSGALPNPNKVMPEFQNGGGDFSADIQGGVGGEKLSNNEGFPRSGVKSDGTTSTASGSFQKAFNSYDYAVEVSASPTLAQADWRVDCAKRATPNVTTSGKAVWDEVPDAAASFSMMRWTLAGTGMTDAFYSCNPIDVGTVKSGKFQTTVHFDEFGTINEGTTGLSKHWWGHPIDARQTAARTGTLWWREYDNALVILNADNDDTNPAVTVVVADLPGGAGAWKRINGVQDAVTNDDSVVNANFTLDPIDGIILQRNV